MGKITTPKIYGGAHSEGPVIPCAQVVDGIVGLILKAHGSVARMPGFIQKLHSRASMPSTLEMDVEIHNMRKTVILIRVPQLNLRHIAY